ncbi:MAG: hypothetical protein EOO17_01475 [Chloroflexi bacterium]|nr:MAG: hypothetical protein EOO17_01475 [Chloroflexota bacterium]
MLINQLTPVLLLPTIPQQIARVAAKEGIRHRSILHDWQESGSFIYDEERVRREQELNNAYVKLLYCDRIAMNIALKLLRSAFGRYSVGVDPYALRMFPTHMLGSLGVDTFAAMVQTHAQRFVRSSCSIDVTTSDRQLWLNVKLAEEPKLKKTVFIPWIHYLL